MDVPISFTGPTSVNRSKFVSNQRSIGFYSEASADGFVIQPFPGLALLGAAPSGADRGMINHKGVMYKITGTTLYSVDSAGTHTVLGSGGEITGGDKCIIDGIGDDLVIATDGKAYHYDESGGTVTEITDVDLETPNAVTVLNNRAIFDGDDDRFAVSDVSDPTSINALNYGTAESKADNIVRPYAFQQRCYMFGSETIEPWWNSGVGNPPFDRVEGGLLQKGLAAIHSIGETDEFLYFLGDDRKVYRISGGQAQPVSTISLSNEIEGFTTISDAIGFCFTFQGQNFYSLSFPSHNRTFCFNENVPVEHAWFEVVDGRWAASSHCFCYGKNYVADYRNANIYELNPDDYSLNSETYIRTRDSGILHGGMLGAPGREIFQNKLTLYMETGVGLDDNLDPPVSLQISDDGGRTWGTKMMGSLGKAGEYIHHIEFFDLGSFYRRMFRISVSSPVFASLHSAVGDFEIGL